MVNSAQRLKNWQSLLMLVEDELTLARAVRYTLEHEGFRVQQVADGAAVLRQFRQAQPDLVLLDIMLPGVDGLRICRAIRTESSVPILMLTARDTEADRVLGLEAGADDYLTKPFGMGELTARVRALLRRTAPGEDQQSCPITLGSLYINPRERRVMVNGSSVRLRRREFDLLAFLAAHPEEVFSRDTLLERVWGYDFPGESRTVDVHMRSLRACLGIDPAAAAMLQTVRHVGYCLRVAEA